MLTMERNCPYGGMPGKLPEVQPIITFKDLSPGLKGVAIRDAFPIRKGEVVTLNRVDGNDIYFTSKYGNRKLSQIEFCLYFNKSK